MKQEKLLSYENFLAELVARVQEMAGAKYRVYHKEEVKNNATKLDGIVLHRQGETVAPSIYLNQYYEQYQAGETLEVLAAEVLRVYQSHEETATGLEENVREALRDVSEKVYYRLINYEMNQELLAKVPHRRFFDLAVTYYCIVYEEREGIGSVLITNERKEELGVTEEELMQFARVNTPRLFPVMLRPMDEVLCDLLAGADQKDTMPQETDFPVYVLTNRKGINGAACLLYPEVTGKLAARLQSDFYVLPSSIHELIVIPDCGNSQEELCRMVRDINRTQVPQEEVLSNHVYRYSMQKQEYQLIPGTV